MAFATKEQSIAYNRAYYLKNRDKMRAGMKRWREKNSDHHLAKAREYHHKNREVVLAKKRAYWRKNLTANRDRQRERKFGLSAGAYAEMHAAQNGCCAICRESKSLVIDHNHTTGAVRSLLCSPCNTALGLLKENPARLRAALAYLKSHASGAKAAKRVESPRLPGPVQ